MIGVFCSTWSCSLKVGGNSNWSKKRHYFYGGLKVWQGKCLKILAMWHFTLWDHTILSSLLWEWWGAGTGCPDRLWMHHPWRCSRPGWMGPWAAWSSIKGVCWWPCLWQGVGDSWFMILEVPSYPGHSVILWFWERLNLYTGDQWGRCHLTLTSQPLGWQPRSPCPSLHVFGHQPGPPSPSIIQWFSFVMVINLGK